MNELCHTYEWVMSHIWMSHVSHMNESCHTYEWVMSHIWMSHVTHMNESSLTYEWVMSRMNASSYEWEISHVHESCHACMSLVTHAWVTSIMTEWGNNTRTNVLWVRTHRRVEHVGNLPLFSRSPPNLWEKTRHAFEWLIHVWFDSFTWHDSCMLIERTLPPREGFLFTMFPDQEPCVRGFTTRCDGRISSWNLLHTALDQGT